MQEVPTRTHDSSYLVLPGRLRRCAAVAQGTQLELGTKGILRKKESESLLQEEMLRICEVVLETPPLNRTVKQLKHLANMAKALGFTIGGPDAPEFVVVVSRHDYRRFIWVAFFSRWQRYRC